MVLLAHTGNATHDFSSFYAAGGWRGNQAAAPTESDPMSGQGSKVSANSISCAVLGAAVRIVALRQRRNVVSIADAPCGDFTWMPHCLDRIASEQPTLRLRYQGIDVVPDLIRQLNAGEGRFLVGGRRRALVHADRITLEPFVYADLLEPPPAALVGRHDIVLSHHVLMHTRLEGIEKHIAFWEALRARWLVVDSWPTSDSVNRELPRRPPAYRTVDVHAPPLLFTPAACAEPDDSDICWHRGRQICEPGSDIWRAFIELHRLPLRRGAQPAAPQFQNGTHWSSHAAKDVRRCGKLLRDENTRS